MSTARKPSLLTGRIALNSSSTRVVTIEGYPEDGEFGVATIELRGDLEGIRHLTVRQADELAAALQLAARHARGETVETALDRFLKPERKPAP